MNIAYVRVSTVEQNEQRQIEAIKAEAEIDILPSKEQEVIGTS